MYSLMEASIELTSVATNSLFLNLTGFFKVRTNFLYIFNKSLFFLPIKTSPDFICFSASSNDKNLTSPLSSRFVFHSIVGTIS